MRIPIPNPKETEEFKQLVKNEFGLDLTDQEATRYAIQTLSLVYVLRELGLLHKSIHSESSD